MNIQKLLHERYDRAKFQARLAVAIGILILIVSPIAFFGALEHFGNWGLGLFFAATLLGIGTLLIVLGGLRSHAAEALINNSPLVTTEEKLKILASDAPESI